MKMDELKSLLSRNKQINNQKINSVSRKRMKNDRHRREMKLAIVIAISGSNRECS